MPSEHEGSTESNQKMNVRESRDLEYVYRDTFNLYIGAEEVVMEFGNRHRAIQNQIVAGDRIVLSVQNAFRLQDALGKGLQNARNRMLEQAKQNEKSKKTK